MNRLAVDLLKLIGKYNGELSKEQSLDFAIEAAQVSIDAIKTSQLKEDKLLAQRVFEAIVSKADEIKNASTFQTKAKDLLLDLERQNDLTIFRGSRGIPHSSQKLSKKESLLLWSTSSLNGGKFPPWSDSLPFNPTDFAPGSGDVQFLDTDVLGMSQDQQELLEGWKRPREAIDIAVRRSITAHNVDVEPSMLNKGSIDLVQDAATDCSLVASLCSLVSRTQAGHEDLLNTVFYPFDPVQCVPLISSSGKYIIRLYFNGSFRKVVIDDRLPVSKTGRLLHAIDRQNPNLLWPLLLEKAYLKVMGGYDFPGSNSGTDLWVLTGWIPEQAFFRDDDLDADQLWRKLEEGLDEGKVMATLGTGKISSETALTLGLVPGHAYAILDYKRQQDQFMLLIKNPWQNGTAYKDYHTVLQSIEEADEEAEEEGFDTHTPEKNDTDLPPGAFWMRASDILQNFEALYMSWDPAVYEYREELHFVWCLEPGELASNIRPDFEGKSPSGSVICNPQFIVTAKRSTDIFLVLTKFFKDKSQTQTSIDGYLCLNVFESDGKAVIHSKGPVQYNEFSDSTYSSIGPFNIEGGTPYTVVLCQDDLKGTSYAFTLSAFANSSVKIETARPAFSHTKTCSGNWDVSNCGGRIEAPEHTKNPQFSFVLQQPSPVALMLECDSKDVRMNVRVLRNGGRRATEIEAKYIVLDSGPYVPNSAFAQLTELDAGEYTIICSTYEAMQKAAFKLRAMADQPFGLSPFPREGAGMLCYPLAPADLMYNARRRAAPLQAVRAMRIYLTAKVVKSVRDGHAQPSSPILLTLEKGQGPERHIFASSGGGAYSDNSSGVRTQTLDIEPSMTRRSSIWVVLARMDTIGHSNHWHHETVQVEVWTDTPQSMNIGVWREWEEDL